MGWQYRTILFEFQKDGLLGDRYIDDDEMENVLNEQGQKGWELVSVTPVQEGLLSFLKRPLEQPGRSVTVTGVKPVARAARGGTAPPVKSHPKPRQNDQEKESTAKSSGQKPDEIGGIKIS